MSATIDTFTLAPTGSTGNNTHTAVGVNPTNEVGVQITVEAAGATPTCTFTLQGSNDGGTNWTNVSVIASTVTNTDTPAANVVLTAVGAVNLFVPTQFFFAQYRLVTTANTNITYRAAAYAVVNT